MPFAVSASLARPAVLPRLAERMVLLGALLLSGVLLAGCQTTAPTPAPADAREATAAVSPPAGRPVTALADTTRLSAVLPVDPAVRIDTLGNGLRYYIRHNEEPETRAELRLAIDAGSILETEAQRGLAHFLEHMLFNGTRRFEEDALVDFLELTGMRFGPDINAYTSFDETVYTLTVPTDSADILARSFDILEDWAAYATLSDEEIDKERGVIIEEWRLRDQNAGGRIRDQQLPLLLHDARYAERVPIGDTSVIRHAAYDELRRFYRDWYRPDLMAVVVVGDVDVDSMEAAVQAHFSALPARPDAPERPTYDVPGHDATLFGVITDPEFPYTVVEVLFKRPTQPVETVGDYRDRLARGFFRGMLNDRLAELARSGTSPFLGANTYEGSLVRPLAIYGLRAQTQEDSLLAGLAAILREAERVRQHGFTATELARAKTDLLRSLDRQLEEKDNITSASFASSYVGHFVESGPLPSVEDRVALVRALGPSVTLADINRLADRLLDDTNRVVTVTMPDKPGLTPPTEAELEAVFDRVAGAPVAPYEDDVTDAPLLPVMPAPAAIVARDSIPALGVTTIELANGVRVVMKPTDFKADEVRMVATSPGGTSLIADEAALEASYAAGLVSQSGVGAFDRTALQKRLTGQVVGVSPYIGTLDEGFRGAASPDDLETLFQLIHLYVTAPRADSSALAVYQNQLRSYLQNRSATPGSALQDTLIAILYGDNPRFQVPTPAEIDGLDLATALAIYQERFADVSDFSFVFVGNFDVDVLAALAQTYLGSLPAAGRTERARDIEPPMPEGVVVKAAYKGLAPRSEVLLLFHGDAFTYEPMPRHRLRSLAEVLELMLIDELREERGGVYNVGVNASSAGDPAPGYQVSVSFSTDPDRVDELTAAVLEQIRLLQTGGASEENVAKVKEQQRRERETALETNSFWTGVLDFYETNPDESPLNTLSYSDDVIRTLTPQDVQAAAERYLDLERYVQVVLYPEDAADANE